MTGVCAFCSEERPLRDSHVLPAFVFRWLRNRSGTGHIRHTENPNLRVQDGLKLKWLCDECEGRFSRFETAFATKVFYPWEGGNTRIEYEQWLLQFCVSVSWRVLKYAYGKNRNSQYTTIQKELVAQAEQRWRTYLRGEVPDPGRFEQHLLILDLIEDTSVPDLPKNINRFIMGAVTFDVIGSKTSLMTYAKLGKFTIIGMVQKAPNIWEGTKVRLNKGVLKPGKFQVPAGLLHLMCDKARSADEAIQGMSNVQKAKIDEHVIKNIDAFASSDQFASILADAEMFGIDAVIRKD